MASCQHSPEPLHAPRILVADDNEDTLCLMETLLSRAGYVVNSATDGEEAWEALRSAPYDLLLSDHNMPRLCGLDLVARMRAAGMMLPVIVDSGSPEIGQASDYPSLALSAVLHKPMDLTEVLDSVRLVLPPPQRHDLQLTPQPIHCHK